ncbi:MAG: hypothetical protein WCH05_04905 [Chlorobiaceae bacterium]
MQKGHEEKVEAVTKLALQFLAEVIGQCPAGLENSTNPDIAYAVVGFQYGAVESAAHIAGLGEKSSAAVVEDVLLRINGMSKETGSRFLAVMPTLAQKEYPPIGIGGRAIISYYNSTTDEEKMSAASSLQAILRQIDES